MSKTVRRIVLFVVIFLAILGGYFAFRLRVASQVEVPTGFSESRAKGAVIAQEIVNISNSLVEDLELMQRLDREKKYKEAMVIADNVEGKVIDLRTKALSLAKELETMAVELSNIKKSDAREAALDSISRRMDLISRLVSYTERVSRLMEVLRVHFRTGKAPAEDVSKLIEEINNEVKAINDFNAEAGRAMDRFDGIVR